jgi:hypothetical protein
MKTDGRTDRETDMANLIILLCNFANAPKKETYIIKLECRLVNNNLSCTCTYTVDALDKNTRN